MTTSSSIIAITLPLLAIALLLLLEGLKAYWALRSWVVQLPEKFHNMKWLK